MEVANCCRAPVCACMFICPCCRCSCKYLFVWSCALANCDIDWPTVPNVFSSAVVFKVTWGCCTITGCTGPGGPGGPGGPCLPGCLGGLPFPGGPQSSGGPPSSGSPPSLGGLPLSRYPLFWLPSLSGGLPPLS